MITLKELHEHACTIGCANMRAKGKMDSCFLIPLEERKFGIIMTPWSDANEKYAMVKVLRDVFRENHVSAYSFITEAWMATVNPRTEPELMNIPPCERSQRDDILWITSRNRDGDVITTRYLVTYHADRGPTLGPPEDQSDEMQSGYLANMFEREPA